MNELIKKLTEYVKENSSGDFHYKYIEYICKTREVESYDELLFIFANINNYVDSEAEGDIIYSLGWSLDELYANAIENNDVSIDIIMDIANDTEWTIDQGAFEVFKKIKDFAEMENREG